MKILQGQDKRMKLEDICHFTFFPKDSAEI